MIYTKQTKKAINIAYNAHQGQFDKYGLPYILHPIHVAEQMNTEEECIVAILHDVVEDTDITMEQLEKDFSYTVIEALTLLTRDKTKDYMEYIRKLSDNPIARNVKLADLQHNTDPTRLKFLTAHDNARNKKYKIAFEFLNQSTKK